MIITTKPILNQESINDKDASTFTKRRNFFQEAGIELHKIMPRKTMRKMNYQKEMQLVLCGRPVISPAGAGWHVEIDGLDSLTSGIHSITVRAYCFDNPPA